MAQDPAFSPDPSQHNFTSSEYVNDDAVRPYDSTQDAQRWYDDQVNEDAQQKAERLNRLRLQLERAAAREGTSTGAILERLEEYAPTQRRLRDKVRTKGLAPLPSISTIIRDDFSTNANHIVLKPKKKRFEPGKPLDYKEAICYDSDESSEGDLFDDLEVLGEEG